MPDGGSIIEFEVVTPVATEGLISNIRATMALGLPQVCGEAERSSPHLRVIANGPSALFAPLDGDTLALNGALGLFVRAGLAPTYWAACDPQELVADFIPDDPPRETVYLVASKCHPRVFERLRGRKVLVWHLAEDVTLEALGASAVEAALPFVSITLTAFGLMYHLGFRSFETWGWDGCYLDGRDHASSQAHAGQNINVEVGDKTFRTTTTWALEAQTAVELLTAIPYRLTVNGGGLIGAMLDFHAPHGARFTPTAIHGQD